MSPPTIDGSQETAQVPAPRPSRLTVAARIYLVLQVFGLINEGLFRAGLPALRLGTSYLTSPVGITGLQLNGLIGLAILVTALRTQSLHPSSRKVLLAVALVTTPAALSGLVLGSPFTLRALSLALASLGVLASSMLAGHRFLVLLGLAGGAAWTWGSLIAGVLGLIQAPGVTQTIDPDLSGRYREWVGVLGLDVNQQSFGALVGLSTGRAVIGEAVVLLLLVYLRAVPLVRPRVPLLLSVSAISGASLCLFWSLSRVSVIALIVGVVFGFAPWNRLPTPRGMTVVLTTVFLAALTIPLVAALSLPPGFTATNTVTWRMSVWSWYLHQPGILLPFGRGPEFSTLGISHPHHQMLELWGAGGLIGLAAFSAGLYLMTQSSVVSSARDNGLAVGSLASLVTYGMFQMAVSPSHYALSFVWVIFLITLGGTSTCRDTTLRTGPTGGEAQI